MRSLAFDDVLILPKFSSIQSRADVSLVNTLHDLNLGVPIISSNMDTITEVNMAKALNKVGAAGALHRFTSIENNVEMFKASECNPIVSIGVGDKEFERAKALIEAGATKVLIDVAHGASIQTVQQYDRLRVAYPSLFIIVGNFATYESFTAFMSHSTSGFPPDALKLGLGGGGLCSTRVVTGCGLPTLATLLDFRAKTKIKLTADGGIKNSGDIAKALAAGADYVMLGSLLAGTYETPGELLSRQEEGSGSSESYKIYRGSASKESYEAQGKTATHRAPEGESTKVAYKGLVGNVIQNLEGGLRSALSYVGATNLTEFKEKAQLVEISTSAHLESKPHTKG